MESKCGPAFVIAKKKTMKFIELCFRSLVFRRIIMNNTCVGCLFIGCAGRIEIPR